MPANTKPVPWNEIKRLYEAGKAANAIARDMTAQGNKISKQAILKRSNREGWASNPQAAKVREAAEKWQPIVATHSQTGNQLATGPSRSATQIANWGKRTPENAAHILAQVELTGDQRLAARSTGIHPDTLKRWRDDDQDFADQLDAANAKFCQAQVGYVVEAGKRGDWKASDKLLQVNPMTREDWGGTGQGGGHGLVVNFRFDLNRGAIPCDEDIIEIETVSQ
jgi:hypothetical protein